MGMRNTQCEIEAWHKYHVTHRNLAMYMFFFCLMKANPANINQDVFVWSVRNPDLVVLLMFQDAVSNAMMQS